jgi:uncharacterized damage-inducible protein DinB
MEQNQELEMFWQYIKSSINRIFACMNGLKEEDLNWSPIENANSLYVIGAHVMGNIEANILGVLGEREVHRNRDAEFSIKGDRIEPLQAKWNELQGQIQECLSNLPEGELDRDHDHSRRGKITGRKLLIIVARHMAEHVGHAELTRDLLFVERGRKVPEREY